MSDTASVAPQIDSLYFTASVEKALALSERAIAAGSNENALQWRAARAELALGMLSAPGSPQRKQHYDSALAHARRGLELAPTDIVARYWVAAAAGRRTNRDDPILSIKLAYDAYNQVTAILAVDSLHAGAHHVMGLLNSEVLRAPKFVRFIAGRILRLDIAQRANWPDAERHMRRAVELDPQMMMYAVDLADLYGRAESIAQRDSVLTKLSLLHPHHPMDRAIRDACNARWHLQKPEPRYTR